MGSPSSNEPPVFIVAFSGHRHLDNPDVVRRRVRRALVEYKRCAESKGGALHLHGSLAYGADLIAAEEAEALGIPFHAILPKRLAPPRPGLPPEGFAADFTDASGAFRQDEWDRAMAVHERSERGARRGTSRIVLPESPEPDCYYDAGIRMLGIADALLAVWDGQVARGLGGSAEICDHARMLGIPTRVISPHPDQDEDRITEGPVLLEEGHELALSLLNHSQGGTAEIFHRLDQAAGQFGSSYRTRMAFSIRLHLYATLLAALAASMATVAWAKYLLIAFSVAEGCLVTVAWWMRRADHRSKVQSRWLDLRFAAELVRSIRATRDLVDPLYPCVQKHRSEWARFARTLGLMLRSERPSTGAPWTYHRAAYVRERLDEQAAYFESRQERAAAESNRMRRLSSLATDLAPFAVLAALSHKVAEKAGWGDLVGGSFILAEVLRFLPIAFPLVAGYLGSLLQASDAERRRIRYGELAAQLRAQARTITHLRTPASVSHAVIQAEEVLLSEQLEWRLRESHANVH